MNRIEYPMAIALALSSFGCYGVKSGQSDFSSREWSSERLKIAALLITSEEMLEKEGGAVYIDLPSGQFDQFKELSGHRSKRAVLRGGWQTSSGKTRDCFSVATVDQRSNVAEIKVRFVSHLASFGNTVVSFERGGDSQWKFAKSESAEGGLLDLPGE